MSVNDSIHTTNTRASRVGLGAGGRCGALPVARPTVSFADRFWTKVAKSEDGCWLWTASIKETGYGQFRLDGRAQYAHRIAYELCVGPIPDGLQLDHLCRVRHCVNPDHLEPVTQAENAARGSWAMKTHCPRGHEYTPENVYFNSGRRYCCTCVKRRPNRSG